MGIAEAEFQFISDIVRKESAIVLESGKEYLVESRLAPIVKQEGFESISELVTEVQRSLSLILKQKIVEALTTNETSFFRDVTPFDTLRMHIFPELLEKRAQEKKLTIWCAAASTGQEPFTIAMLLKENFPELSSWNVQIFATDISEEVLAKARSGSFSQMEVNRGLPASYLIKYFEKKEMRWCLKSSIVEMVRFEKLNLLRPFSTVPRADVVMIRNVLIYFDREVKIDILSRVRGVMKKDACMFLGGAETTMNLDDNFERRTFEGSGSCYCVKE